MCEPATIIGGIALASQIAGAIGEHKAQNKAAEENKVEALKSLRLTERDISARQSEEQKSFAGAINESEGQLQEATGQARTSASEAGVSGMSVDLLLGDLDRQGADYKQSLRDQMVISIDQLQRMKSGATAQAQSRINQVPRANPFATGLRIGGAVTSFAGQQLNSRAP